MRRAAREGDLSARARADTAHRVHMARLSAGIEEEASVEAEAGALLAAEMAHEIHDLREMGLAYLNAMSKG